MNGSGGGCPPSPGSNGSRDGLGLPGCDAAASAGTWRHKLPVARMAPGGSRTALRLTLLYPLAPCGPLAWLPSRCRGLLNPPNRRIRTRTSGGVGGEESRDFPLSRSTTTRPPQRTSHRLPHTSAHPIRRQPPRQRPHRWGEAMRSRLARLLRLDVSRADDLAPGRGLELDADRELLRRAADGFEAERRQALLHVRERNDLRDLA